MITTGEFQVGDWFAAPGSKTEGVQQVEVAGHAVDIPVFVIHGARPGPTLAVTAGIHGAEYASIAAALEVGQALDPADLAGRVVVAPVANRSVNQA